MHFHEPVFHSAQPTTHIQYETTMSQFTTFINAIKTVGENSTGFSEEVVSRAEVVVIQWFDNKSVHLASNYIGQGKLFDLVLFHFFFFFHRPIILFIGMEEKCHRWDEKNSQYIDIDCPESVQLHIQNMGGVDKLDQMITLYRTFIRSRE